MKDHESEHWKNNIIVGTKLTNNFYSFFAVANTF